MSLSKKQIAERIIKNKTAQQMLDFLENKTIEQQGLEQAFYDFLGEKRVVYFLDWNITDDGERRLAAQYLAKLMGEFVVWTNSKR